MASRQRSHSPTRPPSPAPSQAPSPASSRVPSGSRAGEPAIVRRKTDLAAQTALWRRHGETVALVPTMGALHEGHMALVRRARGLARRVVVSIFVNPLQFGPLEDLDRYPRREAEDRRALAREGVDLIYAPDVPEMYPKGFATTVSVAGLGACLCGATRPGHFDGVATVVAKLLMQVLPDVAVFGEKDYQQLLIIHKLVKDLDIPVRVEGCPTAREPDGLALSSRNAYLTPEQRAMAKGLHATLQAVAVQLNGGAEASDACDWGRGELRRAGFAPIDYIEVRDARTLAAITGPAPRGARILAAAWLGRTRLIDNIPVP